MKKIVISILAIALIVVCIGCGSDKEPAKESKKPVATKTVEETKVTEETKTPETPNEAVTPAISEEEPEIIGSADDIVAWRYKVGTDSENKMLVDKGKVFAFSSEPNADYGKLLCLDAKTGKKYWENDAISSLFNTFELLATDRCIIAFNLSNSEYYPYKIISFDIETGEKVCEVSDSLIATSELSTVKDDIFFTTIDGYMHCYDAKTGKRNWEAKGLGKGTAKISAFNDKVFCCASKTLSCLNAQDGKQLWQFEAGNFVSLPTVSNGKVYFGTQPCSGEETSKSKDYFYCFDLQTGTQEWSMESETPVSDSPFIIDKYACFMDCRNNAYIGVDLSEKKKLWQINMDGSSGLDVIDATLYLMIDNKWSIVDIATGQVAKKLDFGANYDFAQQKNYSIVKDYVQCNIPGTIITDSMFESLPKTRLQRLYTNDNIYVSNYPNIAAGKVYACTLKKMLWETPKGWTLEPTSFPGIPYSYFWVFNDKVLVMRKDNNAYFYTCLEKSTGKKLWEIPKGNFRIDAFDNGILTLHSIASTKDIDMADGSVKQDRPISFDNNLIAFETTLSNDQIGECGACVYDLSEGLYLYVTFECSKVKGIEKDRYLVDKNGKITPLFIKKEGLDFENIKRYRSKLYVMSKTSSDYDKIIYVTEVDTETGKSISVKETDVPASAVLLQKAQDYYVPNSDALDDKTIKKIDIKPHKPNDEYYGTFIKGIKYGKYMICQREISEGMEYIIPYSDYTGIYDAKTLKKFWSYDKKVENVYLHDSTIIINGSWDNQVVLFCDLATGKTLLKYDKATLLSKVGDICFVASGSKLLAVNLKKLPK